MKKHTNVLLLGMHTVEEWQCAHAAVGHVEKGRRIYLEFEGPDGDEIKLSVQQQGRQIVVRKEP